MIALFTVLLSALHGAVAPTGQLAYVSGTEQEDRCVTVVDLASGAQTRVGTGQRDGAPVWSPDGQWLAFTSSAEGGSRVHLVRADGSEPRTIAHAQEWNRWPRWSPDGTRLAYTSGGDTDTKVAVYDLSANTEQIWGGGKSGLLRPVWVKASGGLIAIRVLPKGEHGITTDLATVSPTDVTPAPPYWYPSQGNYAEWAVEPDAKGLRIAFESNDGGDREIFVLKAKRGAYDVSNHRAADWNPVWAPNGKWIVFESFRGGRRGVYRVFADTARVFPVAVSPDADNWSPAWSPDGQWLAFVSDRSGDPELYVVPADGAGEPIQITHHAGEDYAPAWRPTGKKS